MSLKRLLSYSPRRPESSSGHKAPLLADRCFRVFGSPYSSVTHQHITYLYLKRVPIKTYCGTFASTKLYSVYHGAASVFCALTPEKECCLLPWHLMERVELRHGLLNNRADSAAAIAASSSDGPMSDSTSSSSTSSCRYLQHSRNVLLDRKSHPQLHMLSWVFMVYGNWWLTLTGMMYRWLHSDAEGIVSGYMNYFLMMNSIGIVGPLRDRFRRLMCGLLELHGVSEASRPFMVEHFESLCAALDAHIHTLMQTQQVTTAPSSSSPPPPPPPVYLLGTPHPTLADVAIGSAFSGYFLLDVNTTELIESKFPHLQLYLQSVAGYQQLKRGESHPEPPSDTVEAHEASEFPDDVPESLKPVLMVMEEVFPFLVDQCEAFRVYMSGNRSLEELKRVTLDEDAEGGLHGLEAFVLDQRTPITTVMLIDRHLLTVFCRAQDLEIATTAAREVLDIDLAPFNKDVDVDTSVGQGTQSLGGVPSSRIATAAQSEASTRHDSGSSDQVAVQLANNEAISHNHRSYVDPTVLIQRLKSHELSLTEVLQRGVASPFPPPDPNDENALPHVYSRKGGKDLHRFGNYETALQLRRSQRSLSDVMASLYQTLWQMHCPQFTLSAVSQNRKVFVAVIPEHEYSKKRQRDSHRMQ
jgi:hypothetical protein